MQYMLIHPGAPGLDEAWDDKAWAALTSWLDEAIEAAARHPMARGGIVEVRPFRRLGED